jgi:spore coat protein U-like protein
LDQNPIFTGVTDVLNSIRIKTALAAGAATAAFFSATPAMADSKQTNLAVSAAVDANCTISATPLDFGSVDTLSATAVTGTGGVAIACTNGTSWSATANTGTATGATFANRRLRTAGGDVLNYTLFTDAARTTIWGDGTDSTSAIVSTGTGTTQNVTIYGRIPAGQTGAPAGSYTDLVEVTVTY